MAVGVVGRSRSVDDAGPAGRPGPSNWAGTVSIGVAALRAGGVAVAGMAVCVGVALLVSAFSDTGVAVGPGALIRAGLAAFAAGQGLPLRIGPSTLTLTPLLPTLLSIALLAAGGARRRPAGPGGRGAALAGVCAGALSFGVVASVVPALAGPSGVVDARHWDRPTLLAFGVLLITTLLRGEQWLLWWDGPGAERVRSVGRGAVAGAGVLVAGSALVLAAGLIGHWRQVGSVFSAHAPGLSDGAGLAAISVALLPNAVLATTGLLTGPGFQIGAGHYSLFAVHAAAVPPLPTAAAVPVRAADVLMVAVAVAVPVVAGLAVVAAAAPAGGGRWERVAVVGASALGAGVLTGLAVAAARGGVTGGLFAVNGASPWAVGGAAALELAVVGVLAVLVLAGRRSLGARADPADDSAGAETNPATDAGTETGRNAGAESDTESDAGTETGSETGIETGRNAGTEADIESAAGTETDTDGDANAGTGTDTDTGTETDTDTDAMADGLESPGSERAGGSTATEDGPTAAATGVVPTAGRAAASTAPIEDGPAGDGPAAGSTAAATAVTGDGSTGDGPTTAATDIDPIGPDPIAADADIGPDAGAHADAGVSGPAHPPPPTG